MFLRAIQTFQRHLLVPCRYLSSSLTEGEQKITSMLKQRYPEASLIEAKDISSGCGSMYQITVHSPSFKGTAKVSQHKQITELLKSEIKTMHGLTIETKSI